MIKQLSLFPELVSDKLVSNLDDAALQYVNGLPIPEEVCDVEAFKRDLKEAFKDGAKAVLADVIDLFRKYTDLHEN